MPSREGVCRVKNPDGMEDDAIVRDINDGVESPVSESRYRAQGYMPPFDELKWCDDK